MYLKQDFSSNVAQNEVFIKNKMLFLPPTFSVGMLPLSLSIYINNPFLPLPFSNSAHKLLRDNQVFSFEFYQAPELNSLNKTARPTAFNVS